jgi:hypothetical protein
MSIGVSSTNELTIKKKKHLHTLTNIIKIIINSKYFIEKRCSSCSAEEKGREEEK